MKSKIIVIVSLFFLISCDPLKGIDDIPIGITIQIINASSIEIEDAKIIIGGIKDGNFIGTESYTLPIIEIRNNDSESQYFPVGNNRWKPNLELIKAVSDTAYFTFQYQGNETLLYDKFNDNEITNFIIVENKIIKKSFGGTLSIGIYEDLSAKALFHEDTY